eukprot:TRINITY_DN15182_c0_g1_i1.p1 TRINITY_DN15182_c0_g1~~TRINITY_DN15182_c0_g1_i1.p1  ORF type:complete len:310 (-),score=34.15 TRINITY_DN15182_c0_g1_i1:127-933(-)
MAHSGYEPAVMKASWFQRVKNRLSLKLFFQEYTPDQLLRGTEQLYRSLRESILQRDTDSLALACRDSVSTKLIEHLKTRRGPMMQLSSIDAVSITRAMMVLQFKDPSSPSDAIAIGKPKFLFRSLFGMFYMSLPNYDTMSEMQTLRWHVDAAMNDTANIFSAYRCLDVRFDTTEQIGRTDKKMRDTTLLRVCHNINAPHTPFKAAGIFLDWGDEDPLYCFPFDLLGEKEDPFGPSPPSSPNDGSGKSSSVSATVVEVPPAKKTPTDNL